MLLIYYPCIPIKIYTCTCTYILILTLHIEKQRTSRGYDFAKVSKWFAERSDLILLMFDPSKLDISDEFKLVIEELRPYEDKVHCVLNKADSLPDTESLMRVYGALLWSMGKIFRSAEVTRVYVGSYKDHNSDLSTTTPIQNGHYSDPSSDPPSNTSTTTPINNEHTMLFKKDRDVLLSRLHDLPKACGMRKVNDMVKRIRLIVFNVCLLGYLRSQIPYISVYGKQYVYTYTNCIYTYCIYTRMCTCTYITYTCKRICVVC